MFIVNLTYLKPLTEIQPHMEAHMAFIEAYYQSGNFLCSGRKNPRTGGVILMEAESREQALEILAQDPFHIYQLASCELTEFLPTRYAEGFQKALGK